MSPVKTIRFDNSDKIAEFNESWGETLRDLRKDKNISQLEVCNALDISNVTLVNLEKGRSSPTLEFLYRWCEYLGYKLMIDISTKRGNER